MTAHFHPPSLGSIGAGVSVGATVLANLVTMTPELKAISLVVSIVAGLLTVVWHVRRFFTDK